MDWIQYDKVYPLEQAKRLWPDYAADMDTAKESGRLSEVFGAIYSNTDFGRDMVIVRTLYERNVVYPMTKKEALRYNAIVETVVPVVDPVTMQPTTMTALVYVDPLTGQPSAVPVTEAEFEDDGTPVNPSEKWPVISGVREIQALVFSHEYSFETWDKLMSADQVELLKMTAAGAAIERKHGLAPRSLNNWRSYRIIHQTEPIRRTYINRK
jgi:hypothetical protein